MLEAKKPLGIFGRASEDLARHGEAERLGGLEIDHQLECRRLHYSQRLQENSLRDG